AADGEPDGLPGPDRRRGAALHRDPPDDAIATRTTWRQGCGRGWHARTRCGDRQRDFGCTRRRVQRVACQAANRAGSDAKCTARRVSAVWGDLSRGGVCRHTWECQLKRVAMACLVGTAIK